MIASRVRLFAVAAMACHWCFEAMDDSPIVIDRLHSDDRRGEDGAAFADEHIGDVEFRQNCGAALVADSSGQL